MTFAKLVPAASALAVCAAMLAVPARAHAQACTSNTDCPKGTTCQARAVEPTRGETKPGCAGADCPTDSGSGGGSGTSSGGAALVAPDAITMACAPAACTTDADCGGQMVCHTETYSACSGGAAAPCARDQKCEPVTPPTCVETKVSTCMYRWQLPCNAAADCGDGFTCEPNVITSCSGGGPVTGGGTDGVGVATGTGGSGNSSSPTPVGIVAAVDGGVPPSDPMCTTTSTFPGWCRPKATTCGSDADCPAPWTCTAVASPAGGTTDVGGATRPAADAGAAEPLVAPVPTKVCQSPLAFPARGSYATDGKGGTTSTGAPTTGGTNSGPGGGDATSAPESATPTAGSGCSVAGPSASLGGLASLALGLALVARRGRRRR